MTCCPWAALGSSGTHCPRHLVSGDHSQNRKHLVADSRLDQGNPDLGMDLKTWTGMDWKLATSGWNYCHFQPQKDFVFVDVGDLELKVSLSLDLQEFVMDHKVLLSLEYSLQENRFLHSPAHPLFQQASSPKDLDPDADKGPPKQSPLVTVWMSE